MKMAGYQDGYRDGYPISGRISRHISGIRPNIRQDIRYPARADIRYPALRLIGYPEKSVFKGGIWHIQYVCILKQGYYFAYKYLRNSRRVTCRGCRCRRTGSGPRWPVARAPWDTGRAAVPPHTHSKYKVGLGIRSSVPRANRSFLVSKRAKKSDSLVKKRELLCLSFVTSDGGESLTVTLLRRATRDNCSRLLFNMSDFGRKSEFPTLI